MLSQNWSSSAHVPFHDGDDAAQNSAIDLHTLVAQTPATRTTHCRHIPIHLPTPLVHSDGCTGRRWPRRRSSRHARGCGFDSSDDRKGGGRHPSVSLPQRRVCVQQQQHQQQEWRARGASTTCKGRKGRAPRSRMCSRYVLCVCAAADPSNSNKAFARPPRCID